VADLADIDCTALLPATPTREQIERLEAYMLTLGAEVGEVELPTWHHFADGLVARSILIKAGTLLTGAVHKTEHLNIASGDITVWTEAGMKRLTGFAVMASQPGAKRVGLAHADTHWTTVHTNPDNCRDITTLEDRLLDDASMLQSRRMPTLRAQTVEALQ
jgi:hypothetical protein